MCAFDTREMGRPRPVPGGFTDATPEALWEKLWELDPKGELPMPLKIKSYKQLLYFWRDKTSRRDIDRVALEFWKEYVSLFPGGGDDEYYGKHSSWDDRKRGYWSVRKRLEFRHPNGQVYLDASGLDSFPPADGA